MLTFTEVTATAPKCVTKQFTLNPDGTLNKRTAANVYEGFMRRVQVANATEFALVLTGLRTDQCLVYGVPPRDVSMVTQEKWAKLGRPDSPLPRTKDVMAWPSGPGVWLLDYDAPKDGSPPMSKDDLLGALVQACPNMLELCDIVYWPSTSSCIYAGDKQLTGIKGQRLYPMVKDATDIPRAGKALNERLWALGYGRMEVSASGSILERPVFDGSVWQTNRIDFAAGADCSAGLEQRRGDPLVLAGLVDATLDTREAIPDLTPAELSAAKAHKEAARAAVAEDASRVREVWLDNATDDIIRRHPRMERPDARKLANRAAVHRNLMGDWVLQVRGSDGQVFEVTVLEVLDNPAKYHGMQVRDPLEPDYDGGRWVGKLFLYGARPVLHSLAHGGVTFRLSRQPQLIEVVKGKGSETTDALLAVLREAPDVFDFGAELAVVGGGGVHAMDENSLRYESGKLTQFWYWRKLPNDMMVETLTDPPSPVCRNVLSMGMRRDLKKLTAVITAPTLRPDGSVLAVPGFDAETGLLYETESFPQPIPEHPNREQAQAALAYLWAPFQTFPFVGATDRAVHLAALLTAAVRGILPCAPAFAYDAPVQGSGKTLLARCVGVLTEGKDPSVWPHTAGRDDEEVRKRLFTVLRSGARSLIWDNIIGTFDSASLAAALTNPMFSDRVLGASVSSTVPNRMVLLMTGNNLTLAGDLPRRVLVSRIDPQTEKPFARSFDIDPAVYCMAHRQHMIEAALVLMRAMLTHGCVHPGAGKMASFEQWDAWVRQTVIYANELQPGMFGDVMDVVQANQAADPEQEALTALLDSWHDVFGSAKVQTAEVVKRATEGFHASELREALEDFVPNGRLSTKSIGRLLKYRTGRICGGKRLECIGDGAKGVSGALRWFRSLETALIVGLNGLAGR